MSIIDEIKGKVGMALNGIAFNWDVVGGCCLTCPSCQVGSIGGKRSHGDTSPELFRQVLDKAQSECKVREIQLFAFTDPCLHKDLDILVAECTKRDIPTHISTMLQTTKCDFEKLIESRPTEFRISMPGWKKMSYYQSKNAKPEAFDRKFAEVVKLPRHKETLWTLIFHLYRDNADEIPRVTRLAEDNGLKLTILPAIFMSTEKVVEKNYTEQDMELISHLLETPEQSMARMKDWDYCTEWKRVTLDSQANFYLCQLVYEQRFKLGSFLDTPLKEVQRKIWNHQFCGSCIKAHGNTYQNCYADFSHPDPIGEADRKRRKDKNYTPLQNIK